MKKAKVTSILLAFLLSFAFLFSFTQPVMAANVKTNVITQIKSKDSWGSSLAYKFTYNSNGLLTAKKSYFNGYLQSKVTYKYNSNNLIKSAAIYEGSTKTNTISYTYNDNKQLTKRVIKNAAGKTMYVTTFSYNSAGTLKSSKQTFKMDLHLEKGTVITKKYTFKNGVLAKVIATNSTDSKNNATLSYKYDQYGVLKKYTYNSGYGSGYITRRNIYDNGILLRYQDTDHNSEGAYKDDVRKITTKTLSLKKSLSAIVQKQQHEIINDGYCTDLYLGTDFYI